MFPNQAFGRVLARIIALAFKVVFGKGEVLLPLVQRLMPKLVVTLVGLKLRVGLGNAEGPPRDFGDQGPELIIFRSPVGVGMLLDDRDKSFYVPDAREISENE